MRETLKNWLRWGLWVFGAVCILIALYRTVENAGAEKAYDYASEVAFRQEEGPQQIQIAETTAPAEPPAKKTLRWVPEPVEEEDPYIETLQELDLDALREVNPDVIGWILVPNTKINYPIMQGQDNDFYLKHTWQKEKNAAGSVFMEYRNDSAFTDFNTILYAHNMNNGTMFGELNKYRDPWYWGKNPYVYVANDDGIFRYEVFAYHKAKIDSFVYGLSFNQKQTRENFIASALEAAEDDLGVEPAVTDRILTMSTCTGGNYDSRWVLHARLKMVIAE